MNDEEDSGPWDRDYAKRQVAVMLSLGGSYSDVIQILKERKVDDAPALIQETVNEWVDEDNVLSKSRRSVQRRRLQRQVRLAMDNDKVGDAVRAEAILARLDDQEADAEANKITDDFELEMANHSDADMEYYADHGKWPDEEGGLPPEPDDEPDTADEPVH